MKITAEKTVPSLMILVFMSALGPFGDTEYTPSLPNIAHALGVSYGQVQLSMTVYLLGFALSQLFYGPFSDRFGRRPLIMIAIGAFLVGSLICALSTDLYWLLLGRFVQSLGASGGMVISNAAIRDAFPLSGQTRMFIKVNAVFALAPAVGPIAGSLIDHYLGWQANFYLLAILAVLLMISVYFAFPETNRNRNAAATRPRIFVQNYRNFFGHPDYVYHVVVLGLGIGVVYCSLVEAPHLVMVELGYPSKAFVVVSLSIVLGFMLGAGACAVLQKSLADTQLILIGLLIMLAGSLATGYFRLPSLDHAGYDVGGDHPGLYWTRLRDTGMHRTGAGAIQTDRRRRLGDDRLHQHGPGLGQHLVH